MTYDSSLVDVVVTRSSSPTGRSFSSRRAVAPDHGGLRK